MILLIVVTGMVATALWLTSQASTYSTTAAILLKSTELPSETVSQVQNPGVVSATQVFTEAQVLRSQRFATRLAERLDLMSDPRFNPALVEPEPLSAIDQLLIRIGLRDPGFAGDNSEDRQQTEVVAKLLDLYSVSASEQHNVIVIRAQYTDPVLVAQIVNETARLYIDTQIDEQVAELDRDIQFMRQRSEEIAARLLEQQTKVSSLMLENQLLDESMVRNLLAERSRLQIRLEAPETDLRSKEELQARIADIDAQLGSRLSAEIKLSGSQTVLQTEASRLDAIKKRLDELEAQRETPTPSVVQISRADVPTEPSGPSVRSTLAVSLVVFSFLAAVAALLRESLDSRVLYKDHIERLTGLNVITSLVRLPRGLLRRHPAAHVYVASDARPGYSNAVRALVSASMEGAKSGRAPIVFIGSAKGGEGKSSIATSMAVAAAMDDLRVLLIDFDVHRFGATRRLGMRTGKLSFGDVLSSRAAFAAAVKETGHAGVDLLNFCPESRMSRRVLQSERAQEVIDATREAYDLVIIDTPPFLASEEAGSLHRIVDSAILVSRWGEVDQETLAQTARMMRRMGLPVVGIAINAVPARTARSYGFLAYRDDYYRAKEPADA